MNPQFGAKVTVQSTGSNEVGNTLSVSQTMLNFEESSQPSISEISLKSTEQSNRVYNDMDKCNEEEHCGLHKQETSSAVVSCEVELAAQSKHAVTLLVTDREQKLTSKQYALLSGKVNVKPIKPQNECKLESTGIDKTKRSQCTLQPIQLSDGRLQCPHCDYVTAKRDAWYKHRIRHTDVRRIFSCPICDYKCNTSSALNRHNLQHTGKAPHTCVHCNKGFKQKCHLDKHIVYKHKEKQIQCNQCSRRCADYSHLVAHLKSFHNIVDNKQLYMQCDLCSFMAHTKRDLRQHMKFHKPGAEVKYSCDHCSFVSCSQSRLASHARTHSQPTAYICDIEQCQYRSHTKHGLQIHKESKHHIPYERKQVRNHCQDQQSGLLSVHSYASSTYVKPTSVPGQTVPTSRRTSATKDNALTISQTSSTAQPQQSNEVSYKPEETLLETKNSVTSGVQATVTQGSSCNSTDHNQLHRIYACHLCTMRFVKMISLYKHLQGQHGYQFSERGEHVCIACSYRSSKRANLLTHLRKHADYTTVKTASNCTVRTMCVLYVCSVCTYADADKTVAQKHVSEVHAQSATVSGVHVGINLQQTPQQAHVICKLVDITKEIIDRKLTPSSAIQKTVAQEMLSCDDSINKQ